MLCLFSGVFLRWCCIGYVIVSCLAPELQKMCKKGSVRIRGGAQYASPVILVPQTYPKFLKLRGKEALGLYARAAGTYVLDRPCYSEGCAHIQIALTPDSLLA